MVWGQGCPVTVEVMLLELRMGGLGEMSIRGDMAQCLHARSQTRTWLNVSWGLPVAWGGETASIPAGDVGIPPYHPYPKGAGGEGQHVPVPTTPRD